VADVLGQGAVSVAAGLQGVIENVRANAHTIGELQEQLNAGFRSLLHLSADAVPITLAYENSILYFDLNLEFSEESPTTLTWTSPTWALATGLALIRPPSWTSALAPPWPCKPRPPSTSLRFQPQFRQRADVFREQG